MIPTTTLERYFPQTNEEVRIEDFRFTIQLEEEEETFLINLKIRQDDKKEERLVKIRIGLG